MTKTMSRELAATMLIFLCVLAYKGNVDMVQVLVWPFIMFATGAFGIKAMHNFKEVIRGGTS